MRRYCETCKDIVQDGPEPHVCICKHSHLASQCPFCKIEKERDALRARVAELDKGWSAASQTILRMEGEAATLRSRVAGLETEVKRQHEGWTDCHQTLDLAAREENRLREALETIVNPPSDETPDPDEIAKEVLRLKDPALGCLKCFPGDDCSEDCLDRNYRVTDN